MKAIWNGTIIAESAETICLVGNHYFPPDSLDLCSRGPWAPR